CRKDDRKEGISWTKLGSYEVARTCRDVILVYTSDRKTVDIVRDSLLEYQQSGNTQHFADEVPIMTEPLEKLRGVGYAEDLGPLVEPHNPVFTVFTSYDAAWQQEHEYPTKDSSIINFSHSQWRAVFIVAALRIARQKAQGHEAGLEDFRAALREVAAAAKL